MVDLLEMARLKQSGSVEQRLASLEEQVGSGLGALFWGTDLMGWKVALQCGGFENKHTGGGSRRRRWHLGIIVPNWRGAFFLLQKIPPNPILCFSSHCAGRQPQLGSV